MALIAGNVAPTPEDMATRLINWARLHPPVDVEAAARQLGIDVEYMTLSGAVKGMLIREEPRRWLIIVNSRCTDRRLHRFTIAHEIGHWTLHRPQLHQVQTSLALQGEWEREADRFASELLMPAQYAKWAGTNNPEWFFQVTPSAWAYRQRQLCT